MALKKRNKVSAEFSMSSLTDIIFLLLIFFMLTSTLVSQNALNLKLPSSNSKTVAPPSLAVSIKKSGEYFFNGRPTDFESLESAVETVASKMDNQEKTTMNIFSDKDTPVQYVVKVMDLANRLKLQAILATEPSK